MRAQRHGATVVAVSALQRAAALGDGRRRIGRLLRAAELVFELGRRDLVLGLLREAEPLDLRPRVQARVAWIRESFADGIPGGASKARSLAAIADHAGADGDSDLAVKLLWRGSAVLVADPGQVARDHVVAAAERAGRGPERPTTVGDPSRSRLRSGRARRSSIACPGSYPPRAPT